MADVLRNLPAKLLDTVGANRLYRMTLGRKNVVILMYHSISLGSRGLSNGVVSATCSDFEEQMEYLAGNCTVIGTEKLRQIMAGRCSLPANPVMVTFDDGYMDNYLYAYPVLRRLRLPAVISLTTGHIGGLQPFWWDRLEYALFNTTKGMVRALGPLSLATWQAREKARRLMLVRLKKLSERQKKQKLEEVEKELGVWAKGSRHMFLGWRQVREMAGSGIEFAAHTVTHPILTRVSLADARREIRASKQEIEKRTGRPVQLFTYPNGQEEDMSERLDKEIAKAGFSFALSTSYGVNIPGRDTFRLNRIGVAKGDSIELFRLKASGLSAGLQGIYRGMLA